MAASTAAVADAVASGSSSMSPARTSSVSTGKFRAEEIERSTRMDGSWRPRSIWLM